MIYLYFYLAMISIDFIITDFKVSYALNTGMMDDKFEELMKNKLLRFTSEIIIAFFWPINFIKAVFEILNN